MHESPSPGGVQPTPPARLHIPDGTLEALKWLALAIMTLDHINKYLHNHTLPWAFEVGRVAMPLFAFVLAYNLARPGALEGGLYERTMKRLALYGALSTPVFISVGHVAGGWWPLNILFTLLLSTAVIRLMQSRMRGAWAAAVALFVVGGVLVEFVWFAVAFCIASWHFCRQPDWKRGSVWLLAGMALYYANYNHWALVALGLILAATRLEMSVPRARHVFYWYYPTHLAVLWAVMHYTR